MDIYGLYIDAGIGRCARNVYDYRNLWIRMVFLYRLARWSARWALLAMCIEADRHMGKIERYA